MDEITTDNDTMPEAVILMLEWLNGSDCEMFLRCGGSCWKYVEPYDPVYNNQVWDWNSYTFRKKVEK